jgi:hypothetical protein
MARGIHAHEVAAGDRRVHITAHGLWRDHVVAALQDQGRMGDLGQVRTVFGREGGQHQTPHFLVAPNPWANMIAGP